MCSIQGSAAGTDISISIFHAIVQSQFPSFSFSTEEDGIMAPRKMFREELSHF
jgi:hypothetical protein